MDATGESKYPLRIAPGGPDAEKMIAIPIPMAALDHGLTFNGTPLGIAFARLVYFLLMMCFDRFTRKRKPKKSKEKEKDGTAGGAGGVDVEEGGGGNAGREPHPATFDDEHDASDSFSSEDGESDMEGIDDAGEHARDMAGPRDRNPLSPEAEAADAAREDAGDEAYEILMSYNGRKWRKVRCFVETVVAGRGMTVGYVVWFCFYERGLFNRMFLSMLRFNDVYCSKNAPAVQKMRAKPGDYDAATRHSIEINSVTSFKDCVLRITAGRIALPDMQLTLPDLVKSSCPYNPSVIFSHANIRCFFAASWNFSPAPALATSVNMPKCAPDGPRYPWLVMEVPDALFERPSEFADLPIDTVLRAEVIAILRPTEGELTAAQRDAIHLFVMSMPSVMQQRISEEVNRMLEQRDFVYRIGNTVKRMRADGSSEEDIERFFRERFETIHHELFRRPGAVNCSEIELRALRDAPSIILPRATDEPLFPPRSALDVRSEVLRQFNDTMVRHLFLHKGDRFNQFMTVFLSTRPNDISYSTDESVVGTFGEKETGKSMTLLVCEALTCDGRVKRMDSVTAKTFEIDDNFNNHVLIFDEVNPTTLGIDTSGAAAKNGAANNSCLVNAQKQIFTGGYHRGSFFSGDANDRNIRSMREFLLCAAASYVYSQNMRMNMVHMSPLISRFCLFFNTYVAKTFLDPDSLANNDCGLTRDIEASVGAFGRRFIAFAKKMDLITLVYCIYVKMGAFALVDTTFARCVINAMNDHLHAKSMRRYSTRLGDRLRTVIRRTDIWLSVFTLFATNLFHTLLPGKTHLDYDCLMLIDRYVHANGCSVQAIAYVLTLFSTEIIMDTNHIVQEALRTLYEEAPAKFSVPEDGERDTPYRKTPFRSRHAMAEWLTEATGINANDAPNALFALTKPIPHIAPGGARSMYRPLCYAENHASAFLVHIDFVTDRNGVNARSDFTHILHHCLCLERSAPQTVLTSFNHTFATSPRTSVVLGGIHHCLEIAPVRGRHLVLRKHNTNAEDVDHPTLVEYVADDCIVPRDPTLHNRSTLTVEAQGALPSYPDDFAREYYDAFMERKRERAFLAEAVHCVPNYCVSADIMLLDEADARGALEARIDRYFPNARDRPALARAFVLQTEWYRLLHRQWKAAAHALAWLEYAAYSPKQGEDHAAAIREIETELDDVDADMDYAATRAAYDALVAARAAVAADVSEPAMTAVFGALAPALADAVPLPPWYVLLPAAIACGTYRPSFVSAYYIEMLRQMGTADERATITRLGADVAGVLTRLSNAAGISVERPRNQPFSLLSSAVDFAAMPTTAVVAVYDPTRSAAEHLLSAATIAFWSQQRGEHGATLLACLRDTRLAWCRARHAYAVMLEYKMLAVVYTCMKHTLYARVAHERASAIDALLRAEPMPPEMALPGVLPDAAPVAVAVAEMDWPYGAMAATFGQMAAAYSACRTFFSPSTFEAMLSREHVSTVRTAAGIRAVVADEIRTEIYFEYAALFDAHLRSAEDTARDDVHAALTAAPLMQQQVERFMAIEYGAVRSAVVMNKTPKRGTKRRGAAVEGAEAPVSDRARCKRRMTIFQQ